MSSTKKSVATASTERTNAEVLAALAYNQSLALTTSSTKTGPTRVTDPVSGTVFTVCQDKRCKQNQYHPDAKYGHEECYFVENPQYWRLASAPGNQIRAKQLAEQSVHTEWVPWGKDDEFKDYSRKTEQNTGRITRKQGKSEPKD